MPTYQPFDWYEQAHYYDIVFAADTALEADFLEVVQRAHGGQRRGRALEPGCGSGRLVAELASRGWRVSGFDRSTPMLDLARRRLDRRGLSAVLSRGRLESFRTRGRFDLGFCLVGTFRYLLDERSARRHLECMADALHPGGLYVVGLHTAEYGDRARRRERWVASRGGIQVVCNIQSWPADAGTRTQHYRSRMVVRERGGERRFETGWTFRTYDAAQLAGLIRRVPRLEHVATYDFDYDPGRPGRLDGDRLDVVLVLRRRGGDR